MFNASRRKLRRDYSGNRSVTNNSVSNNTAQNIGAEPSNNHGDTELITLRNRVSQLELKLKRYAGDDVNENEVISNTH